MGKLPSWICSEYIQLFTCNEQQSKLLLPSLPPPPPSLPLSSLPPSVLLLSFFPELTRQGKRGIWLSAIAKG